jgi:macrolide transport system ATP-binding/permease protein
MDSLLTDIRHALRVFINAPAFAAAAVLTFALGIAVNVAVFTIIYATLIASLPVSRPDRLMELVTWTQKGGDHFDFSYPLYVDLRDHTSALSSLAAYQSGSVGLTSGDRSERAIGEFVTANYFQMLGIDLPIGPGFSGADELRGAQPVAIVSDALWRRVFAASPSILSQSISINGRLFSIVGVAPRGFDGVVRGQTANLWLTVAQLGPVRNRPDALDNRNQSWLTLIGRLQDGVTRPRAAAELTAVARRLVGPEAADWSVRLIPAAAGDASLVESLSTPLQLLMATVSLILLIASANVANLLLARSCARQPEMALRQALGATRRRIVQQSLIESAVLALGGGAVGLLLASWVLELFEIRATGGVLLSLHLDPSLPIVAFAAGLSLLAALAAGMLPAVTTSNPDLVSVIKGAVQPGRLLGKRRLRTTVAVVQIALSLVLVIGAGLFLRSLAKLRSVDPAILDPHVVAAALNVTLRGYDEARGRQFYDSALEQIRGVPGIQSASLAYVLPATAGGTRMNVDAHATRPDSDRPVEVNLISVSSGFFDTVRVPLLRGRDFSPADAQGSRKVTVINETMERRFWPGATAVGQTFSIDTNTFDVIGVARDTKYRSLREAPRNTMYLPLSQSYEAAVNLVVRSALPLEQTTEVLRAELRRVDPGMPLYNIRTLAEHVGRSIYLDTLRATLISWLAVLALVLAAIGIYGVVSYTVSERTREVGIRMALGAQRADVLRMLLSGGARLSAAGVGVGLLLSWWATRIAATQLYGTSPTDGVTLVVSSLMLVAVVLLATLVPALRATRIDPMAALRRE